MSEKGRVTDSKVNHRWEKHKKRWMTKVERNCEVKADEQPHNKRKKISSQARLQKRIDDSPKKVNPLTRPRPWLNLSKSHIRSTMNPTKNYPLKEKGNKMMNI